MSELASHRNMAIPSFHKLQVVDNYKPKIFFHFQPTRFSPDFKGGNIGCVVEKDWCFR